LERKTEDGGTKYDVQFEVLNMLSHRSGNEAARKVQARRLSFSHAPVSADERTNSAACYYSPTYFSIPRAGQNVYT